MQRDASREGSGENKTIKMLTSTITDRRVLDCHGTATFWSSIAAMSFKCEQYVCIRFPSDGIEIRCLARHSERSTVICSMRNGILNADLVQRAF